MTYCTYCERICETTSKRCYDTGAYYDVCCAACGRDDIVEGGKCDECGEEYPAELLDEHGLCPECCELGGEEEEFEAEALENMEEIMGQKQEFYKVTITDEQGGGNPRN